MTPLKMLSLPSASTSPPRPVRAPAAHLGGGSSPHCFAPGMNWEGFGIILRGGVVSVGDSGNWIEIAYGTSSGVVRVIVQHPETVGSGPQLFQTFTVHRSPVTKIMLSEKHLISGECWARKTLLGEEITGVCCSSTLHFPSLCRQQPRPDLDSDSFPWDDFYPTWLDTVGFLQNPLPG